MDAGNLLAKVSDNLSVRRAFGAAYEKDGTLIIPVAIVAGGGGGGTSRSARGDSAVRPGAPPELGTTAQDAPPQDVAPQDAPPQDMAPQDVAPQDVAPQDAPRQDLGRTDAGGGFGGLVLPAGVYVVKGDHVRWVPAVHVTLIALASLSLARALARARARGRRAVQG
jgi:uncharacterized spore protein YtfJ